MFSLEVNTGSGGLLIYCLRWTVLVHPILIQFVKEKLGRVTAVTAAEPVGGEQREGGGSCYKWEMGGLYSSIKFRLVTNGSW